MSYNANPGPSRLAESTLAKRKLARSQAGRGMACSGCRSKKQRCDRKKPSCSTCIIAHELCTYHKRKPHATVDELEDALQRLQYEYARLKATRRRAKPRESSTQSAYGASASRYEEFRLGEAVDRDLNASQSQCARDSMLASIMSKPADGLNQEPFVDESFLTMPTRVPPSGALTSSSINLQPSPGEGAAWSPASSQHPIRVFTPVGHFDSPGATGLVTSATIYPNQFAVSASPVNAVTFEVISPKYRESHSPTDNTYTKNHIASSPISCRPQPTGMHSHEPNQLQLGLGDKSREDSDSASQSAFAHRKKSIFSASPNTDDIVREPSLSFSRATWWDCLLQTYTVRRNPSQWSSEVTITTHRQAAAQEISQDVRSFFKVATIWLHFIHVPLFFDMFHHPEYRASIQPALILGVLAYSKLLQSSRYKIRDGQDAEERDKIWEQSVLLRGLAQSAFDASYNAGWIDIQLAQAAWILVLYETSAHRDSSMQRKESAITFLDIIIRCLGLTSIDSMDPRAPTFAPDSIPVLGRPGLDNAATLSHGTSATSAHDTQSHHHSNATTTFRYQAARPSTPFDLYSSQIVDRAPNHIPTAISARSTGCPCHNLSLADSPETMRSTPGWIPMPRWKSDATRAEIRQEEARRLVWSSIVLLGGDAAVRLVDGYRQLDLHVSKPENYAIMYPGEEVYASLTSKDHARLGKESMWALLGRTMLLWLICVRQVREHRLEETTHPSDPAQVLLWSNMTGSGGNDDAEDHRDEDVDFAMRVWMETLALEDALDAHTCKTEESTYWQARDYLFSIRLLISGGFRHYIPVPRSGVNFARLVGDNATKWLLGTDRLGAKFRSAIAGDDPRILPLRDVFAKRPFLPAVLHFKIWRTIAVWRLDDTQTFAIDVALGFQSTLRWYEQIWPSPEENQRRARLAMDLEQICTSLGKKMI